MARKDTYYFPHDYEPTSDPKIQAMLGDYGASGYGYFWRVIEMMHSEMDHKLPLKRYLYLAIAKQMLSDADNIEKFINDSIDIYELFESDGYFIWSNRVNTNISHRENLSETRSKSGKLGAIAKQTKAIAKQVLPNAKQNLANVSIGKERIGKDIIEREKEKESPDISMRMIPECLERYFTEDKYQITIETLCSSKSVTPDQLRKHAETFNKYLNGTGVTAKIVADWVSHFGRWFMKVDITRKEPPPPPKHKTADQLLAEREQKEIDRRKQREANGQ